MTAETISARTDRIRPTVMTAPTMVRSCSIPGKPLELGSMSITAVLLHEAMDGSAIRCSPLPHTREAPAPDGAGAQKPSGSELLADADQPVHPRDTGTGEHCPAEGDQHSDTAFGGGGVVAGA